MLSARQAGKDGLGDAMSSDGIPGSDSKTALRVKALESLLLEKGLIETGAINELIDMFENRLGPWNGAKVVARAWTDPQYKERLLSDGTQAISEMGFEVIQGEEMVVVENTSDVHNIIVTEKHFQNKFYWIIILIKTLRFYVFQIYMAAIS